MKFEIHNKRRLLDEFFKVDEVEVSFERFAGGMGEPVRRLSFERGDAVAALLFDRGSNKFVFTNQFRYPTTNSGDGWILEVAAGMLREDEEPAKAMEREIFEETGFDTEHIEPISTFFLSPGGSSERIHLFYAEIGPERAGEGGGNPGENEDIQLVRYTRAETFDLLAAGKLVDAKTIIAVMWLLVDSGHGPTG